MTFQCTIVLTMYIISLLCNRLLEHFHLVKPTLYPPNNSLSPQLHQPLGIAVLLYVSMSLTILDSVCEIM